MTYFDNLSKDIIDQLLISYLVGAKNLKYFLTLRLTVLYNKNNIMELCFCQNAQKLVIHF